MVVLKDDSVSVQCEHGEFSNSPVSNAWLWVLCAIAFPEKNSIEIVDTRECRQEHQKDMTIKRE